MRMGILLFFRFLLIITRIADRLAIFSVANVDADPARGGHTKAQEQVQWYTKRYRYLNRLDTILMGTNFAYIHGKKTRERFAESDRYGSKLLEIPLSRHSRTVLRHEQTEASPRL